MSLWTASYVMLWIVVIGLAFLVIGLLRQLGLIQLRLGVDPGVLITPEGIERGAEAPNFEAVDVQTEQIVRLSQFRGRKVVLVFLSTMCLACRQLVPHLNEVARARKGDASILAVCYGANSSCREFTRLFGLNTALLVDATNDIATQYGVRATPFAFLIDEQGLVRIRGVVNSWPHLEALLDEEGTFQSTSWQPAGQPAPQHLAVQEGGR